MRVKSYRIDISPIAWQRAIHTSGNNRFFDANTRSKVFFGIHLESQHGDEPLFACPVKIAVTFFLPVSKTHEGPLPKHHHKRPYIHDLIRYLVDAIGEILVTDVRFISQIECHKQYDEHPRTEFTIWEL